jgi:hypothetical protein
LESAHDPHPFPEPGFGISRSRVNAGRHRSAGPPFRARWSCAPGASAPRRDRQKGSLRRIS